jgi:DNA-binding MurR/RpiR family transcriptional regulator
MSRAPLALPSAPAARSSDVDVAALLRAQAHALRAQADAIDAQAQMLEANPPVAPGAPAPLLSKQQLAAALSVSTATIDRLCRERAIPFLTVSDSRRFELVRVREALEARAAEEPTELPEREPEAPPTGVRRLTRTAQ